MTPEFSIVRADDSQKPVIANLIQLYLYDMTEDMPFPIGRDGRFEYDFLERFWQHPYLIYAGGELVGFALVIDQCPVTGMEQCWFMAEFFVLKAYRRRGLGTAAAAQIIARHKGNWHIGVIERNQRAGDFWQRALAGRDAVASSRRFDGEDWLVREFVE